MLLMKSVSLGTFLLLLPLFWMASACQHSGRSLTSEKRFPESAIQHVVVVWLKEPGNEEARQKVIEITYSFKEIPGVLAVSAGSVVPSARAVVDDSFDVALVITFTDEQAYVDYLPHPLHRQAVEEVIRPLVERFVVYDFAPVR